MCDPFSDVCWVAQALQRTTTEHRSATKVYALVGLAKSSESRIRSADKFEFRF